MRLLSAAARTDSVLAAKTMLEELRHGPEDRPTSVIDELARRRGGYGPTRHP